MSKKKTFKLSSRERRLGAALIDGVVPVVLFIILMLMMAGLVDSASRYGFDDYGYGYDYGYSYSGIAGFSIGMLICTLLSLAYLVVQIVFYSKSQSIGKAILGMQVVSSKNGKPVGIWWMLLREFIVKKASCVCFMLGYIWILIDKRNRAWHDKILDTYVVDVKPVEAPVVEEESEPAEVKPVEEAAPVVEEVKEEPVEAAAHVVEAEAEPAAEPEVSYGDFEEQNNREDSAE